MEHEHRESRDLRRVAIVYVVVAAAWILTSDLLVVAVATSPEQAVQLQTVKGWGFVAITGLLLTGLLTGLGRRIEESHRALRDRERLLSVMFERAGDAMLIADDERRYVDANAAAERLLGVPRDEIIGKRIDDFAAGPTEEAVDGRWQAFVDGGESRGEIELKGADGRRTVDFVATANFLPGRHLSILRDITERRRAELDHAMEEIRASRLHTLTSALAKSNSVDAIADLIVGMALETFDAAILAVGLYDAERGVLRLQHSHVEPDDPEAGAAELPLDAEAPHVEAVRENRPIFLSTDDEFRSRYPTFSGQSGEPASTGARACLPLRDGEAVIGSIALTFSEPRAFDRGERRFLEELVRQCGVALGRARSFDREHEALRRVASRERRISQIVETAIDAAISIDRDGTVIAWNRRASEMFGWHADDIIGRSLADACLPERYRAHHAAGLGRYFETGAGPLLDTRTRITALHRDGHEFPIELSVTAIEVDGEPIFSGFVRDLSAQVAAEQELDRTIRERATVAAALQRVRPQASPAETALSICHEIVELPDVDSVSIFHIRDHGAVVPLAASMPPHQPATMVAPLPADRGHQLLDRAASGPWIEELDGRDPTGDYERQLVDRGLRATAYVPLVDGKDHPRGLLVAGTRSQRPVEVLTSLFPALQQFAAVTATVLLPQLVHSGTMEDLQRELTEVVRTAALYPVFQPIVRLDDGMVVGHEALTRFDDEASPEQRFATAKSLDLETMLEEACLDQAARAAPSLPGGTWLSINAAPTLILESPRLGALLERFDRPLVIEITERTAITDYAALRAAIGRLPVTVDLAIDDAGAGYSSLRHIVELGPAYVKLHMGLVRDIHRDPLRRAMVAGMVHFAREVGCHLVAEGVETTDERDELAGLGVELGQGYLFGRPVPAA